MKKIISLGLAIGLLVGVMADEAKAVELDMSGYFMVSGQGLLKDLSNTDVHGNNTMHFYNRLELGMKAVVSDDLMGVLKLRLPKKATFGDSSFDVSNSTNSIELQLREAFIDFKHDMFELRSGQQFYSLPGYMGAYNPVLSNWNPLTGFVASVDVGIINPTIAWFITGYNDTIGIDSNAFTLSVPISLPEHMHLNPWVAFSDLTSNDYSTFLGATLGIDLDAVSGTLGGIVTIDSNNKDTSYLVSGTAAMNLGAFTPGVALWYGNRGDNGYDLAGTGGGIGGSGRWGGFNGASTYFFGNTTGMTATAAAPYSPFQSFGALVNVDAIALHEVLKFGVHFMYMMDSSKAKGDDAMDAGAKVTASLTDGLDLTLNANYLRENEINKAFFGGTMQMTF